MDDTLSLIKQLYDALSDNATSESWWSLAQRIESSIEFDPRYSKHERETVARLKAGVSQALLAIREGREPFTSTRQALTALQFSIERRTTGPDGWPLRK
ncbi:MAG: hypothetical protein EOS32_28795 [Mesorhizobium sp.]|uniref:hypothetical protein n=1 Tax=Mesorhizobium sp. TaxID=1871066 RepID=UPI000FE84B7A|nr:hypothetical protein [Mesorhizobium sp.]RWC90050.1 MAG: hypothetical protein EOS32_28795 [Mesorhizobium sp.]